MINFESADKEAYLYSFNVKDIINSITLNDVKHFLESLEVEPIIVNEEKQYIVCPTICHNPLHEAESMKLYWYQNNKIFKCYTECDEAMSIFELYRKFMAINSYPVSIEESYIYVAQILQHISSNIVKKDDYGFDKERYQYTSNLPILTEYSKKVLDYFIDYHHPSWKKDGISDRAMSKFNIKFWLGQNKIIIPHYDINNRLIGIRARALEPNEIEEYGKYRPIQIGNILYTYPLQFNLYGINFHKQGISTRKSAIIVEAEKSVLLDDDYHNDLSIAVACCGSNINKYQISLLTNFLGVNEITIALDKEYSNWKDEKAKKYREKLERICKKYSSFASFSYIWDYDNLLEEKDSPFDKGKDIFEYLYKNRIKVR